MAQYPYFKNSDAFFIFFYLKHEQQTLYIIRNFSQLKRTAQDINQDFWLHVYEKKDVFFTAYKTDNNIKGYFLWSARNFSLKVLRENKKYTFIMNCDVSQLQHKYSCNNLFELYEKELEREKSLNLQQELVQEAFNQLTQKQRSVFVPFYHGKSLKDIMRLFNENRTKISKRKHDARHKLKQWIIKRKGKRF